MRRALIVMFVAGAALHPARAKEIITNGPRIEIEDLTHDFGTMPQYEAVEHVFKFRNVGDETLKIGRVKTSCGCTAVLLSEKELAPGKSGDLKVTFKSGTFSGQVAKHINMQTNDPANSDLRLEIKANVLADLACTPRHLNFGRIDLKELPTLSVKVFSPTGKKFAIQSAKPSQDFIKAEIVEPEDDEGGEHAVRLSVDTPPPTGRFNGSVRIGTDLGEKARLTITFAGSVRARTEVVPPKLFFGVVGAGEQPKRDVTIRATSWEGLKVEKVEGPEGLAITTKEVTEGKEWQVSVQIKGPFDGNMLKEKIKIHLNDTQMKEVDVKVYALISKKSK